MSTTIAALIATLIATGMTSAVSHQFTLLGGCGASLIFAGFALVSRDARIAPTFLIGSLALAVLALVSSEVNTSEFSSTVHVLSCYLALAGLACSSSDLSVFCQRFMMCCNLLLTGWVLYHGYRVDTLEAWQISNPSGAGNLMAAQINMTIPLVLSRFTQSRGLPKLCYLALLGLNATAVVFMMSRNGIGAMLILFTLYMFFSRKSFAICVIGVIGVGILYADRLMQLPAIFNLLTRMRVVNFQAQAPRSVIWQISWDHILQNASLGVGPGEPRKTLAVLDVYHAHNNIIQVAFETGIPSAVIFVVMVLLLLKLPFQMAFARREHFVHSLPIIAYVTYAWTGSPLALPGATLLLAACVNEARVALDQSGVDGVTAHRPIKTSDSGKSASMILDHVRPHRATGTT
jgi:O-antigen ligase